MLKSKDFWAGGVFIVLGAAGIYFGWDLPMGTARRMGPSYFPMLICGGLLAIGSFLAIKGLRHNAPRLPAFSPRPFFLVVAVVLFGVLISLGIVAALAAAIGIACLTGQQIRFVEAILLIAGLIVFSWLVFIWGLGLPIKTWPV